MFKISKLNVLTIQNLCLNSIVLLFCPQSAHCAPHIANISGSVSVSRLHPEALLPAYVDMVDGHLVDRHLVDRHLVDRHLVDKV
jgi:hypothetical protein